MPERAQESDQVREPRASYATTPAWLPAVRARIEHLLTLEENWDSYGAAPIRRDLAEEALATLLEIAPPGTPAPQVFATPRGGLQFEWHLERFYLEVEPKGDGVFGLLFEQDDETICEAEDVTDVADIRQMMALLPSGA